MSDAVSLEQRPGDLVGRYELTPELLAIAARRAVWRSPAIWLLIFAAFLGISAMALVAVASALVPGLTRVLPTLLVFQVALASIVVFRVVRTPAEAVSRARRQGTLGAWEVVASPTGFAYRSPATSASLHWSALRRVERDKSNMYVYQGANSLVPVPFAAFGDQQSGSRAFATIEAWLEDSRP